MLRHVRHDSIYWFCRSCWQEMPDFTSTLSGRGQLESSLNKQPCQIKRQKLAILV
jgi:hypothetical protein